MKKSTEDNIRAFRHKLKNDLTVISLNLALIKSKPENKNAYINKIEERIEVIIKELQNLKLTP